MQIATLLQEPVSKIMTKNPISVGLETIAIKVAELFKEHSFHHLPVVNYAGECKGVISKSDYLQLQNKFTRLYGDRYESNNERFFSSLLASEIMTPSPITLTIDNSIEQCIQEFLKNKARSIVITNEEVTVGIVTPYDILKYLYTL